MNYHFTCPNCGSIRYTTMCLTSNPPQYEYYCNDCPYTLRYYERKDAFLVITQKELNEDMSKVNAKTVLTNTQQDFAYLYNQIRHLKLGVEINMVEIEKVMNGNGLHLDEKGCIKEEYE